MYSLEALLIPCEILECKCVFNLNDKNHNNLHFSRCTADIGHTSTGNTKLRCTDQSVVTVHREDTNITKCKGTET